MEKSEVTEKRRFARTDETVCAWLSFRHEQAAYGTLTMDLGLEGARFSTLHNVNVGEQLLVCLQLPWQNIECKGRICWSAAGPSGLPCFGVRFLDLRETERDYLYRHMSELLARGASQISSQKREACPETVEAGAVAVR
jgi:hypothetical protein